MTDSQNKRVVVVTGAGAGIGKACAIRLASEGAQLVVADIDEQALQNTCSEIIAAGGAASGFEADVSSKEQCTQLVEYALDNYARIDSLVANAGIQTGGNLLETTEEDWQRLIDINMKGVAYSCQSVLPAMVSTESGSIVIISSINAVIGSADMAVYDMTKAAVLALTRNLAMAYGKDGIRVNAVCPGNTITDFHINRLASQGVTVEQIREMTKGYGLLGHAAEPEEIANVVNFLASEQASFITGQTIIADGGYSLSLNT